MSRITLLLPLLFACSDAEQPAEPAPEPEPHADGEPAAEAPKSPAQAEGTVTAGPFTVHPVFHGTLYVEVDGKVFWVDPWSKGPLEGTPKADVVLVTDLHPDHLDPSAITTVSKEGTAVVAPQAVADMWEGTPQHVLANGEKAEVHGVTIEATPMYNLVRGPEEGTLFHDKGRGNGYVLSKGETRLYIAGDTECTDEMKALEGIDLALVPMNLPYTMPPSEAAGCVNAFKPAVAVPYHYRDSDPGEFVAAVGDGVSVQRLEFYPQP